MWPNPQENFIFCTMQNQPESLIFENKYTRKKLNYSIPLNKSLQWLISNTLIFKHVASSKLGAHVACNCFTGLAIHKNSYFQSKLKLDIKNPRKLVLLKTFSYQQKL